VQIRRILFPTDFSDNAKSAFQYGLGIARKFGADLYLVHVVHSFPEMRPYNVRQLIDLMVKHAETSLREQLKTSQEHEVRLHPVVRVGVEDIEITTLAEEERIDLIVMGTHGRTGLAHALLGSVAERVVRRAPCPVLSVKPPSVKALKTAKRR
jgi:universal stress protein A